MANESKRAPVGAANIVRALLGMPRRMVFAGDVLAALVERGWVEGQPSDLPDGPHELFAAWSACADQIASIQTLDLAIAQRLEREAVTPEGDARRYWVYLLVGAHWQYRGAQIDIEVPAGAGRDAERPATAVRADIVVYRDEARRQPWVVVEVKAAGSSGGYLQAQSYARNLGAEFFAIARGTDWRAIEVYRTSTYGAPPQPVEGLPEP